MRASASQWFVVSEKQVLPRLAACPTYHIYPYKYTSLEDREQSHRPHDERLFYEQWIIGRYENKWLDNGGAWTRTAIQKCGICMRCSSHGLLWSLGRQA